MQKEFEKQVKEKMEELDFVPSTPVWSNIEAQIRQEKDRRRLLFWLPFLTLLIGGGITWFIMNATGNSTLAKQDHTEKTNEIPAPLPAGDETREKHEPWKEPVQTPENKPKNGAYDNNQNTIIDPRNETVISKRDENKLKIGTSTTSISKTTVNKRQTFKQKAEERRVFENRMNNEVNETINISPTKEGPVPTPVQQSQPAREKIQVNIIDSQARKKEFVLNAGGLNEEEVNRILGQVTGSSEKNMVALPVKTFGRTKWKFGFELTGGISGAGEGLPLYARRQELLSDVANNAPPPPSYLQNRSIEPSSIENGISFSAGMVIQKQLNNRFALSTGLRYQYLSTTRKVGFKVYSFAAGNMVSGGYTSAKYHDYVNRFHFITLPVSISYRPLKNIPLQVEGGFAFQHLLETNALHFNELAKVYQKDDGQFRKNQVFAQGGLNFSFPVRKLSVTAGPQVQYSLMTLGESYQGQHLFTVGLKTKILFNN